MLKGLYFQRRRIAVTLAAAMVYLAAWDVPATVAGPLPLLGEMAVALGIAATILLPIMLIVLRTRALMAVFFEITMAAIFPFWLLRLIAPGTDLIVNTGTLGALMLAVSFAFFTWMIAGNMLDPFSLRDMPVRSSTFSARMSPEKAWRALVPRPGHEAEYLFSDTKFLNTIDQDEDEDARELTVSFTKQDWAVHQTYRIHIDEVIEGRYFRASFRPVNARGAYAKLNGWYAFTFAPTRDGQTSMQIEMSLCAVPLRVRLFWVMSDSYDEHMSQLSQMFEDKMTQAVNEAEGLRAKALANA